ncbi:hypothetical protein LAZ40_05620 [Cereibacter sphaeroides]|uniref:hypothetical protein n=1 Tax=Cereibacter sphaeroides TaxID=1063 RepID=UPI001F1E26C5|nr:hypothetical protein [Cereibacter sphaeroides]MCE6958528.1 hypothetical protein [Cereibacter sphaeroides]MCE6972809.1 hypothetical protein [Cereibacter sphaeroides]
MTNHTHGEPAETFSREDLLVLLRETEAPIVFIPPHKEAKKLKIKNKLFVRFDGVHDEFIRAEFFGAEIAGKMSPVQDCEMLDGYYFCYKNMADAVVETLIEMLGEISLIRKYRVSEGCHPHCTKAKASTWIDCTCPCLGAGHKSALGLTREEFPFEILHSRKSDWSDNGNGLSFSTIGRKRRGEGFCA